MVWAVLDCDRMKKEVSVNQDGESEPGRGNSASTGEEEEEKKSTQSSILTFAAEKGQMKPTNLHSPFADRIAQYFTKLLDENEGTFDLKQGLSMIPTYVAHTEEYNMSQEITIFAK